MAPKVWMHKPGIPGLLVVRIVEKHRLSTSASREALLTRVLLAMAPKVRKHEPDMPGVLFFRIVEKLSLSTGASREAPVDKWADYRKSWNAAARQLEATLGKSRQV